MENNYYQTFVAVHLKAYGHVKLTLFIYYLFRLYKKHIKKRVRDKNDFQKTKNSK